MSEATQLRIVIEGKKGAGKSTLIERVLRPAVEAMGGKLQRSEAPKGVESVVVEIPAGSLARFCAPVPAAVVEGGRTLSIHYLSEAVVLAEQRGQLLNLIARQSWMPNEMRAALPAAFLSRIVTGDFDTECVRIARAGIQEIDAALAEMGVVID